MTAAPPPTTSARDDVRVARVHLRMGQLTLARAELEDLLRRDQLDVAGLAALAEARWRTGEGDAAADAALDHIDAGGNDDVALCIAAEALAAEGRAADARALMDRLPASDAATLDVLFAGMPRRGVWPAGPVDRSDLDELRRAAPARTPDVRRPEAAPAPAGEAAPRAGGAPGSEPTAPDRAVPGPREVMEATADPGWEGARARAAEEGQAAPRPAATRPAHEGRRARAQLDPVAELEKARDELASKPDRAFLRLSLVLRHDPTLAPSVLQILHLRREPTAALVRGDAQRLLGRHLEAEAAFDAAAENLEVS
jgi:tetratricopeptide (TPR) repeat protein